MNNIDSLDHDIHILECISRKEEIRQRQLAEIAGLSLGMINSILKRLVKKGWLQIRKINNKNIRYIVSADGMQAITGKSYRYLKRTLQNVTNYKEILLSLLLQISEKGYKRIVLVGISDLEFILEYACHKHELFFKQSGHLFDDSDCLNIIAEDKLPDSLGRAENIVYLSDILINNHR